MKIFIDASAFIAGFISTDPNHKKAIVCQKHFDELTEFSTSDLVYFECMTVIAQRQGIKVAKEFSRAFKNLGLRIYTVSKKEISLAETMLFSQKSKNLPFFDCLYVAIVKRERIDKVFTYDKDFIKLGVPVIG